VSIAGCLNRGKTEVRTPKMGVDELGIRFDGADMAGEETIRCRRLRSRAARALQVMKNGYLRMGL
jgi:hypothetical protein